MKIEVLGPGCAKCNQLMNNVSEAVSKAGIEADVVKISDLVEIATKGVLMTPGLIIDGTVVSSGKVLSVDEVVEKLKG